MAASGGLTEEQKRRVEENRRKALLLRAQKNTSSQPVRTVNAPSHPAKQFAKAATHQPGNSFSSNQSLNTDRLITGAIQKQTPSNHHVKNSSQSTHMPHTTNPSTGKPSFYSSSNTSATASSVSRGSNPTSQTTSSSSSSSNSMWHKHWSSIGKNQPQSSASEKPCVPSSGGEGAKKSIAMKALKAVKASCVLISRERFEVLAAYFEPLVAICKMMTTKSYDPVTKRWSFHLKEYDNFMTKVRGLDGAVELESLPKSVLVTFTMQMKGRLNPRLIPEADLSRIDEELTATLMPFQKDGVNFGVWRDGRVLIADDMGLGKTIQALCIAAYYRQEWPLLVVTPSSVRFSWAEQIKKWLPSVSEDDVCVAVSGKSSVSGRVTIISYDLMVRMLDQLKKCNFQVIIMDESHFLKNNKTARTQAAFPLVKNARRAILLSGTPALSRPAELFTQLTLVDSKIFPKFHEFGVRYCNGKQMPWGWDFTGSSHLEELQIILEERIMIRRLKKDVMSQLPSKQRQMVVLDPQSVKVTKDLKSSAKIVDKVKGMERRGALLQYFHETASAKIAAVREYVSDLLEADNKFLVFAHHQEVLEALEHLVQKKKMKYIRIDGSTTAEQRNFFCNRFQTHEEYRIAILSITAANAGLNLTAAKLVLFAELFWNPGILLQAEDRAHRIGQQDSVTIHYLVARGTADDHIWPMVQNKLDILSKAGLSKDDFSSADTKHVQDPNQQLIMDFFEDDFAEESFLVKETEEVKNKKSTEKSSSILNFFSASSSEKGAETASTGKLVKPEDEFTDDLFDQLDDSWDEDIEPPDKKAKK